MKSLTNDQLVVAYLSAKENRLDEEFIILLEKEMNARGVTTFQFVK